MRCAKHFLWMPIVAGLFIPSLASSTRRADLPPLDPLMASPIGHLASAIAARDAAARPRPRRPRPRSEP